MEKETSTTEALLTVGAGVTAAAAGILLSKGAFKLLDWGLEKVFGDKEAKGKKETPSETVEAEVVD